MKLQACFKKLAKIPDLFSLSSGSPKALSLLLLANNAEARIF
jgi:hypothetical protein